jgi:hypothetical protein
LSPGRLLAASHPYLYSFGGFMGKILLFISFAAFTYYIIIPPQTLFKDFLSISFVVVFLFIQIWITLAYVVVRRRR